MSKIKFQSLLGNSNEAPLKGAFFAEKLGITNANFNNKLHRKRKYEKFNEEQEKKIIDITKDLIRHLQEFVKNPDFTPELVTIFHMEDVIRNLKDGIKTKNYQKIGEWVKQGQNEKKYNKDNTDVKLLLEFKKLVKEVNKSYIKN